MEISNFQLKKAVSEAKLCVKSRIRLIIATYFVLLAILLAVFSIKTAFSPFWQEAAEESASNTTVETALLRKIIETIDKRDKSFSGSIDLELKDPFD